MYAAELEVEPCEYPVEAEYDEGQLHITRCGQPSVDDEDAALCAEHLDRDWPRVRGVEG